MLDELRIHGLGVIDDAVLPLGPGLTVVTGETGAGKTMVVTGLLLLFGGRADSASVRTGRSQATVDGRLVLPAGSVAAERVRAAGGELDDDELLIRRVVGAAGRSRAYAGGTGVPAAVLSELAENLLAVHGQSDQLRLVRPAAQRNALDRFAGIDLHDYTEAYTSWRALDAELLDRTARTGELRRESELLEHGLAEIEQADPQPGEAAELALVAGRLAYADALRIAARAAHANVLGDPDDPLDRAGDVVSLLGSGARGLDVPGADDPELAALARRMSELAALAADLGAELREYADALDTDPARLEQLEQRRAVLAALIRRYCDEPEPSVEGVLRWAAQARERLAGLDVSDEALAALRDRRDAAAAGIAAIAGEVSVRRRDAAVRLGRDVTAELAGLAMPTARIDVAVLDRAPSSTAPSLLVNGREVGVGPEGADEVEITLAAHPGAPALPVGRGASGGELSRVMLALEVCLVDSEPVPTLVFDEVDAGVGGRAAVEVGRRLALLAGDKQVLVVTHLPQVAAFADRQIVVDKPLNPQESAVTASDVRLLDDDQRVGELARMLAGSDSADRSRARHGAAARRRPHARPGPWRASRSPPRSAPAAADPRAPLELSRAGRVPACCGRDNSRVTRVLSRLLHVLPGGGRDKSEGERPAWLTREHRGRWQHRAP